MVNLFSHNNRALRSLVSVVLTVCFGIWLLGCSSGEHSSQAFNYSEASIDQELGIPVPTGNGSTPINKVFADINAYQPPSQVDSDVFNRLKVELIRQLELRGTSKLVSNAPDNEIPLSLEDGQFRWSYYNTGDYDQNSEVGLSDITPIAIYFQKTKSDPEWAKAQIADGDGNGEINLADISPIAVFYMNTVTGYKLYNGPDEYSHPDHNNGQNGPGYRVVADKILFTDGVENSNRLQFSYLDENLEHGATYWVRPYNEQHEGKASSGVYIKQNPVINSITPNPAQLKDAETGTITCDATDPEGGELTYLWSVDEDNDGNPDEPNGLVETTGSAVHYSLDVDGTTTVTFFCRVESESGGFAEGSQDVDVEDDGGKGWPVITATNIDPDPVMSGESATVTLEFDDLDSTSWTFEWVVTGGGSISGAGSEIVTYLGLDDYSTEVTYNAPVVLTSTPISITCTVTDSEGHWSLVPWKLDFNVVAEEEEEELDYIEVGDLTDIQGGSGIQADPYRISGGAQIPMRAISTFVNDITAAVEWFTDSPEPATGFGDPPGLLYVSAFDSSFKVWAEWNSNHSNDIWFQVVIDVP